MLQADTSVKAGLKAKRKRAGWDLTCFGGSWAMHLDAIALGRLYKKLQTTCSRHGLVIPAANAWRPQI